MIHLDMELGEKRGILHPSARIFGAQFQLEQGLLNWPEQDWSVEGYIDRDSVEHIRIAHVSELPEQADELWEMLSYHEEESPLEMLADLSLQDF